MNPLAVLDMLITPPAALLEKPLVKKTLLLFFVMSLLSSAWASHIGIITFNTGTTLSSADLNANFSALNTGKQDRVTGACDAGLAISVINADGTVTCEPVGGLTVVTGSDIVDGTITNIDIADGTIGTLDIATGGVQSSDILNGTITNLDILDGSIIAADLAANSVGAPEIADGSIGSADVDAKAIQLRVSSLCPVGTTINTINANGTVVCETPIFRTRFAHPVNIANSTPGGILSKIATIGTFTKQLAGTDVLITYQTHGTGTSGNWCDVEIRIDDTQHPLIASRFVFGALGTLVNNAIPIYMRDVWEGLSVGPHTIDIWARGSTTSTVCGLNAGNWLYSTYAEEAYSF